MTFAVGEWVLGRACGKCSALVPLLRDAGEAEPLPISGGFSFRCAACGARNATAADRLVRFRVVGGLETAA